jgi:hypothetical protein
MQRNTNRNLKLILVTSFWSTFILSDTFGENLLNRAKESARCVITTIQSGRRKIKDSVKAQIDQYRKSQQEEYEKEQQEREEEIAELERWKKLAEDFKESLEHERSKPQSVCPTIIQTVPSLFAEDNQPYPSEFYRLLQDPQTDINIMYSERSLLHFVWYRRDKVHGFDMLSALLARPDLKIDQKGNDIGDCGDTVLGMAVSGLIYREIAPYLSKRKADNSLDGIKLLLARGANPELMSDKTKAVYFDCFETDNFESFLYNLAHPERIKDKRQKHLNYFEILHSTNRKTDKITN